MEKALELQDLTYVYRGNWMVQRIKAIQNLSLEVYQGECFGFLGHNGAGKTTTIKCVLGLIHSKQGAIRIFGEAHNHISSRARIGYVPEQPYFYDHLTVREIMRMYACLSGVKLGRAELERALEHALDLVGMDKRVNSPMRSLSKGLTQRVALAQAIVAQPSLLILDEPFSGLDPIGRKEFRDLFGRLKSQGTTIFICSHILSDVEFLCDRVSILSRGELKGVFDIRNRAQFGSGCYELKIEWREGLDIELGRLACEPKLEQDAGARIIVCRFPERQQAERALAGVLALKARVISFNYEHGSLEDLFVRLVAKAE